MDLSGLLPARAYDELVRHPDRVLVGLDFDGTLAPIVDDPAAATIHPEAHEVLLALAVRVGAVAVVTGRPARQVLALGGLDEIGAEIGAMGKTLYVLGQYGNERWTSQERRVISPAPPKGLARFVADLPSLLRAAGEPDAFVEQKGLAVGVHTRRLPDPQGALDRILPVVSGRARSYGLAVEPGKFVVELRAPGMDKGLAIRRLVDEVGAGGLVFAGDDLGDVEAFRAVRALAAHGVPGILVQASSPDQHRIPDLAELADLEVDGPTGVLAFLRQYLRDTAP